MDSKLKQANDNIRELVEGIYQPKLKIMTTVV